MHLTDAALRKLNGLCLLIANVKCIFIKNRTFETPHRLPRYSLITRILASFWKKVRRSKQNDHAPINHVFAYWDSDDHTLIEEMKAEWRSAFPNFKIFGDSDIIPLIAEVQPDFIETYRRIRLASAKSDIARLLVLYRFGGLYVDCHTGVVSREGILALFDRLNKFDHIFVNRSLQYSRGQLEILPRQLDEYRLISAMIMSRPGGPHFLQMARQAMANLTWKRQVEARDGFAPYSLWFLCGPHLVQSMTIQPGSCNREVRRDLAHRVEIIREEEFPVVRNRYGSYRAPGNHWSEREKTELLFER